MIVGGGASFADGLKRGVLLLQRCRSCGDVQLVRSQLCRSCSSSALDWAEANGSGRVWAVTIVARAPDESFRALAPYTLVLVELDEGPRLMGHGAPGVAIGDRVVATLFDHADRRLLKFVPDSHAEEI